MADNRQPSARDIVNSMQRALVERLPPNWSVEIDAGMPFGNLRVDPTGRISAPNGECAELAIEVLPIVEPRRLPEVARKISAIRPGAHSNQTPIVAAPYLSPRSRELLENADVGYVDMTGNIRLQISRPGLYIFAEGAERNPWPQDSGLRSLRGRGAARAVRAIVDHSPPFGIRELAESSGASAPTLSRVIDFLDREGIVTREPRGAVLEVDWRAAIRRWASDYSQTGSNITTTFLEPRGIAEVRKKLSAAGPVYAATGAFAAQFFDPVAQARTATLYVEDPARFANQLDLRESDAGANVTLLEPFDPVVFDRTVWRGGLRCVAPSQLSADLLTGPGREPSQGEEMLYWMGQNEDAWRS